MEIPTHKELQDQLIKEQAKSLKFAATIVRMQKRIDVLEKNDEIRRQFDEES